MGVKCFRWVHCRGPEISVKGLRYVRRALGWCGRPEIGMKGVWWVWRA